MNSAFMKSSIPGLPPPRRGKVRDIYDLGDKLLMVATDRISAFDWVLPNGIPDKGRVLTEMSAYWLDEVLCLPNHLITDSVHVMDVFTWGVDRQPYDGRVMLVRKVPVVPIECVVRGYLAGSGWKEYQQSGTVCGIPLPPGLRECDKLPEPIFTPATKEESGHDINISFEEMGRRVCSSTARRLRDKSLQVYGLGAQRALEVGIIIADTKFEWGEVNGELVLIDEVLTPDSSRFWPAKLYQPGQSQPSFDKQFVRDYLETTGWDKNSPPPPLPDDVVAKTRDKYIQAYEQLTGEPFLWK